MATRIERMRMIYGGVTDTDPATVTNAQLDEWGEFLLNESPEAYAALTQAEQRRAFIRGIRNLIRQAKRTYAMNRAAVAAPVIDDTITGDEGAE